MVVNISLGLQNQPLTLLPLVREEFYYFLVTLAPGSWQPVQILVITQVLSSWMVLGVDSF